MLQGENVRLREVRRDDLVPFLKFVNDPEVTRYLLIEPPFTMEDEEKWYEMVRSGNDITFTIETVGGKVIGNISLRDMDCINRKAMLGIMIGEKGCQNKGYGTEAIGLLLRHAFEEFGLARIYLTVDSRHAHALRCYERCGFKNEGSLRMNRFKRGEYADDVVMSILRTEWSPAHQ